MGMAMLAYLDALLAALAARDTTEIDRLLAHPLARILSPDALADATAERRAAAPGTPSIAPLRLFQHRYRTAQLLADHAAADPAIPAGVRVSTDVADRRRHTTPAPVWSDRRAGVRHQMELPLSA
jgi:hypothetical protein